MMGPGFGYRYGFMNCGSIAIVIGILLIVLFFFFISKNQQKHKHPENFVINPQPLELLKVRLAKGEITPEEYQKVKETLMK